MSASTYEELLTRIDLTTVIARTRGAFLAVFYDWPSAANDPVFAT